MTTETQSRSGVDPTYATIHDKIAEEMERLKVPGVGLGLMVEGQDHVAGFGVTNVDYPSPVLEDTLFQIGSTTKTVTGTAVMRLVEQGKIDLDAPVRTYLPDLLLKDESVAAAVTTRHLLTHTAGWVGDFFTDTGRGDDALSLYAAKLADLEQLTPLGEIWSYNNAAVTLAGRVVEAVAGKPYETVARELVLDPLGMTHSFFFPEEVMLRSFVVGHNDAGEGPKVASPWPIPRNANPAGGLASPAGDQLRYARFHMGDGTAEDGSRVLSAGSLKLMQTPVTSAGDMGEIGLTWFIRDVDGVRVISHGGSTNGQQSVFLFVPERQFALTVLTNAGAGSQLGSEVTKFALKQYLGISEPEIAHEDRTPEQLAAYTGQYQSSLIVSTLSVQDGALMLAMEFTGEFPADEAPPAPPPTRIAFWGEDKIVALDGPFKDAQGDFLRDKDGKIVWLRFGGRINRRR